MPTMTAAERRDMERNEYNAELAGCAGHELLALLSEKWVTLTLHALSEGPRRHSEIARTVAGASQKMLTQTLRKLERDGLVSRRVTASVPARVDYELTALGVSLLPVQRAVKVWADARMPEVHAARAAHDGDRLG